MSIVGTAATGAPLAGAAISLKCVGASFSTSADASGSYRIPSVPVDAAPCLLRAQQASTVYIAPVANPGAGTANINATPLTHLLSSRLLGQPADLAFQNAGPGTLALVNPTAISAARGVVRAQIDRLGIDVPGLTSDWIGTPFQAQADDPHDRVLEALRAALASKGLTVPVAALQLASSDPVLNLPPRDPPSQACTPRLIDGFAGADRTRWIKVGSGPGETDGIGIGGGPGLTSGASVEVSFADGTRLTGAHTDYDKGMVTLVPCGQTAALPALVRMTGAPGSTYYDPGSGRWASFEGRELHAVVSGFEADKNLAVTPFTEAIYRRVVGLGAGASEGLPWYDAGRVEVAHDEVLAVVNDQLPGMYRLERLDRMPLLIDHRHDIEGSLALPGTQAGIHAIAVAAMARASAVSRPSDPAPALEIAERFAADMVDGVLDNPYAGLDPAQVGSALPVYDVGTLWQRMTIAAMDIGRKVGVPALWSGKPFPLGLVRPSGHRSSVLWPVQYTGLYSDGVLRTVVLVDDGQTEYCGAWCNPARKVRASATSAWWVHEVANMVEFNPETHIGRFANGQLGRVRDLMQGEMNLGLVTSVDSEPPAPIPGLRNGAQPFVIDIQGKVRRLDSDVELPLPARARQLSSDGMLVYALLSNGEVYVLNPEIIAAEARFLPIEGMSDEAARHQYWANFRAAGYAADVPLRLDVAQEVCRIGGSYLQACNGQLLVVDRVYYWILLDNSWGSFRAPGDDYIVRPASGLDGKGWRAFKAPLSVDIAWDDAVLRLLSKTDGSYVLQSDTWGMRDHGSLPGDMPRRHEVTQQLVESWLAD